MGDVNIGDQADSVRVPSNHRQAERVLARLVTDGEWEIDEDGRIWRTKARTGKKSGGSHLVCVARRRVEHPVPCGYLQVRSMIDGVRTYGLAHRLVWQCANGDIPDGLVINHLNGIKGDNRLSNLDVTTYSGNSRHASKVLGKVRDQSGTKNSMAKLTDDHVVEIRRRRASGERLASIAADYGVTFQTVSDIARGDSRASASGDIVTTDGRLICTQDRGGDGRFVSKQLPTRRATQGGL